METAKQCLAQPQTEKVDEHLLTLGWQAARNGEPFDKLQPEHWKMGFRLWHWNNPACRAWH
jgi:hypothetical protein